VAVVNNRARHIGFRVTNLPRFDRVEIVPLTFGIATLYVATRGA
jgi:hypothetical protein